MKKLLCLFLSLCLAACNTTTSVPPAKISFEQAKATFVARNYPVAFKQMMLFAVKGYKDAEYAVGFMYVNGLGVKQNEEIGTNWLRRAAKKGQPLAKAMFAEKPSKASLL